MRKVKIYQHAQKINCYKFQCEKFIFSISFNRARSGEDEYMAFGLSGSEEKSQMEGADVSIAYMDGPRGYAADYNITAKSPVSTSVKLDSSVKKKIKDW